MSKKTVAELTVETLALGVTRVYGLVGHSLNGITDTIRDRSDLQWVRFRLR